MNLFVYYNITLSIIEFTIFYTINIFYNFNLLSMPNNIIIIKEQFLIMKQNKVVKVAVQLIDMNLYYYYLLYL